MSSIPTKHIDCDLAVGRNVTAGGNANFQGNARVGHNLKVEGWLEARNIKGANKGLFASVTKLREAYPRPHDGWWALVGATLPAAVYEAEGGEWVATGGTSGTPTIDCEQYNEAVEELKGDVRALEADVTAAEAAIAQLGQRADATDAALNSHKTAAEARMTSAEGRITAAEEAIEAAKTRMDGMEPSIRAAATAARDARTVADSATEIAEAALTATVENHNQAQMIQALAQQAKDGADAAQAAIDAAEARMDRLDDAIQDAAAAADAKAEAEAGKVMEKLKHRTFVNVTELLGLTEAVELTTALQLMNRQEDIYFYNMEGTVVTFRGPDGWQRWQKVKAGPFTSKDNWRDLTELTAEQEMRIRHNTPIRVASEEEMERMIAAGETEEGQLYYIPEE